MRTHSVTILAVCAAVCATLVLGACADGRDVPSDTASASPAADPGPGGAVATGVVGTGFQVVDETEPTCGVLELSDEEWRARLTPEEYRVLREGGTERAFTGKYWKTKTPGKYVCSGCDLDLFASTTKFESGTGWPSFWEPIGPENVETKTDTSHGMVRTEILCGRCGAHLGHVFPDGPEPTGQRYCVNSMSLKLVPDGGAGSKD